jgi:hypothetical protein
MDFDVKDKQGGRTSATAAARCSPTCCQADPEMDALITKIRAPYEAKLAEKLAVTDGLLYRRGNFNGSWDQLLVRRVDGRAGRRDRLLARLPLGHQPAAGRRHHPRADDGPAGHHLPLRHRHAR